MTVQQEFAALHHGERPFVLPNAWDVASGLLLQEAGFPAVATTSLGVNAVAGLPDASGGGRDVALNLGRTLAGRLRVPVTVDFEGGYSDDPAAVAALARDLADAGVAGINLEDGLPGGGLRPASHHTAVIAAVLAAAPGLFVNARTDTYWLQTPERLGETLRRVEAYREAGAHGVFVPGLTGHADTAAVAARAGVPLNVLWQPGTRLADLAAAGVARVSTGSALYRAALGAALRAAAQASEAPDLHAVPAGPVDYHEVQRLLAAAP